MLICSDCKDYELCKLGEYRNLLSGHEHPVVTDNVIEAQQLYSKIHGEGVMVTDYRYNDYPNKVKMIYKKYADAVAKKKIADLKNKGDK